MTDDSADVSEQAERAELRTLFEDAAAGLNPGEREVIELQLRQGLEAGEVATVLGVSRNHAHALLSRARDQLETCLAVLLVGRAGRDECGDLGSLLTGWDGRLTVLLRKRVHRHIEHCATCTAQARLRAAPGHAARPVARRGHGGGRRWSRSASRSARRRASGRTRSRSPPGTVRSRRRTARPCSAGPGPSAGRGFPKPVHAGQAGLARRRRRGQAGCGPRSRRAGGGGRGGRGRGRRRGGRVRADRQRRALHAVRAAQAARSAPPGRRRRPPPRPGPTRPLARPATAPPATGKPAPEHADGPRSSTAPARAPCRRSRPPGNGDAGTAPARADPAPRRSATTQPRRHAVTHRRAAARRGAPATRRRPAEPERRRRRPRTIPPQPPPPPPRPAPGTLSVLPDGGTLIVVPGLTGSLVSLHASGGAVTWSVSVANDPDDVVTVSPAAGTLTPADPAATLTVRSASSSVRARHQHAVSRGHDLAGRRDLRRLDRLDPSVPHAPAAASRLTAGLRQAAARRCTGQHRRAPAVAPPTVPSRRITIR